MNKNTYQRFGITEEQNKAIRELAARNGWGFSQVVRYALDEYLEKQGKEDRENRKGMR
jgi:hypothetical protein